MKYFNFKFLTVLFALALAIPLAVSAEEVTVCDGTSTTEYLPLYGYYFDEAQHNQMIYPASELGDLPSGARITSITFYPDRDIPSYLQGYDVNFSMANIDDGTVFETDAYGNASPLNVDVDLVATTTIDNNPWAITLADPFTYNGEDLLIDVLTPVGGYAYLYFTCKSFDKYYGYYSYGTTTKKGLKVLPKITITYEVGELDPYKAKVSPSSIDFGKTAPNNPLAQNVTVKNTGANAITPTVSGLAAPFSTTYTPTEIASGETVTIPVVFSPTTANTFNGTLHIGAVESEAIDFDVTLTGLAAYELTVCDGTTTNSHLPIYGLYVDEYIQNNQMIYPAEMLQSINGKKITSMTLYINNDGNKFATTATFSLKNLDANTPEYEITPVPIEGYTEVKTETVEKNSSLREWTITFDQPFVYNGGDLLLNVATTIGNYGSTYFYGVGQTTYQSYYTSGNTGKTRSKFLPKVTFGFEDATVVATPVLIVEPDELILDEDNNTFVVMGENLKADVTISVDNENFTVTPATIAKADAEASEGATVTVAYTGTNTEGELATITVASEDAESVTVSVLGAAPAPVVVAAPTFTPEPGSYTEAQTVTIACTTEDAVVYYSTDGGESWTEGNTVTVNEDMTLMAKAVVGDVETVANAVYSFEFPVAPIDMEPFDGYFYVKNLGNEQYANVLGRKTLRFTDAPEDKAGTVIRLKTDEHGQVISLRSQACDLQGYANKAMNYVPEFVHLVADKLELEGVGQLFGETGVDAILDKFNEAFDHHLYVEPAEGGYRIYGKTPSMQHVVDFYRENQAKCDAKLPMLEEAINNAIDKILEKTNGSGASILEHFSLHTIWEKMNNPYLTEPVDDASTMAFYHQVLMNKDFVWDFAYETAMIYWTNLKNHPRYENEIKPQLGEFAEYLDKIENVRPNFKYYIVQKNDKPDFISEGNTDIKNNAPRTIWSVEPRTEFVVNVPEEATYFNKYVTTLYTDFAYDLPEGVIAYKVVGINDDAYAQIKAIDGTIPAQMPVLLISKTAGDLTLTLNNNDGKAHSDNQLKGPDYLIGQYQIKSASVEKIFDLVKSLFGEEIYNNYMLDYEHLMLRYAGNVKNKYFFGLSEEDIELCTYNDGEDCVVRSLAPTEGDDAAFHNNWTVSANKAFLVNDTYDPIKIMIKGDIDRNGKANIADVTALIDIMLYLPDTPFTDQYDYEAADFDESGEIKIKDLTELIDYLLDNGIEGGNGTTDDDDIVYDN